MDSRHSGVEHDAIALSQADVSLTPGEAGEACSLCTACLGYQVHNPPKLLPCLHSACTTCLKETLKVDDGTVACPLESCRQRARVSASLDTLPTNYMLIEQRRAELGNDRSGEPERGATCSECLPSEAEVASRACLDCSTLLCSFHAESHSRTRFTAAHTLTFELDRVKHASGTSSSVLCPFHRLTPNRYCTDCSLLFCAKCHALGAHTNHATREVEDASTVRLGPSNFLGEQSGLTNVVECMSGVVVKLETDLERVGLAMQAVNDQATAVSKEITASAQTLVKVVEKERDKCLDEVDGKRWARLKKLERQQADLRHLLGEAKRAENLSEQAAKLDDVRKILTVKGTLHKKASEMNVRGNYDHRPLALECFGFGAKLSPTRLALQKTGLGAVVDYPFVFDESAQAPAIKLSENKCTAEATRDGFAAVLGKPALRKPFKAAWSLKIWKLPQESKDLVNVLFGVSPWLGLDMLTVCKGCGVWAWSASNGWYCRVGGEEFEKSRLPSFRQGDVLDFIVDVGCITLTHRESGVSSTIVGLGDVVYPFLQFSGIGCRVSVRPK